MTPYENNLMENLAHNSSSRNKVYKISANHAQQKQNPSTNVLFDKVSIKNELITVNNEISNLNKTILVKKCTKKDPGQVEYTLKSEQTNINRFSNYPNVKINFTYSNSVDLLGDEVLELLKTLKAYIVKHNNMEESSDSNATDFLTLLASFGPKKIEERNKNEKRKDKS